MDGAEWIKAQYAKWRKAPTAEPPVQRPRAYQTNGGWLALYRDPAWIAQHRRYMKKRGKL
jgi:hypothetical protein